MIMVDNFKSATVKISEDHHMSHYDLIFCDDDCLHNNVHAGIPLSAFILV